MLRDNWRMHDGDDMLTETVDYELAGEAYPLVDRFPPLRLSLEPGHDDVMVQPCKRLEVLTSTPTVSSHDPLPQYLDGRTIFVTAEDREILAQVASGRRGDGFEARRNPSSDGGASRTACVSRRRRRPTLTSSTSSCSPSE